MSELARKLLLGVTLAALSLIGATAAQAADPSTRNPTSLAPTEGRVGEAWHQRRAPAEPPTLAGDARRVPLEGQVGEAWHPRTSVPAQPGEPSQRTNRVSSSAVGVLTAAVLVSAGLAVSAARRARRRARPGHAA